jgi:hypothetical protein
MAAYGKLMRMKYTGNASGTVGLLHRLWDAASRCQPDEDAIFDK